MPLRKFGKEFFSVNRLTERFFESPVELFSQSEVAVAMPGSDFSRHGLIKRAMSKGEIIPIRRGLYCLAPRNRKKSLSIYTVSQRIYGPSYVSMETALSFHGWIPEAVYSCTCASFGPARDFDTPLGVFNYRRVPQNVFYADVERHADADGNVFLMASPIKALADYIYIKRLNWNIKDASASLRIEPDQLATATAEQITALIENYSNLRIKRFLISWKEKLSQ